MHATQIWRYFVTLLLFSAVALAQNSLPDSDRDSIPDEQEQLLLEKFRPDFMVSNDDCDVAPSEFAAGELTPRAVANNGTIYGQVTPLSDKSERLEVRYYHLWSKDCGRRAHAGDVEYVAALLKKNGENWRADYWYAAAHEGTVCDRSAAARADDLKATERGPTIWISSGKHASFLQQKLCAGGCGGDVCRNMKRLDVTALVNLGEPAAPMNGAIWVASKQPGMEAKMRQPIFETTLLANLEKLPPEGLLRVRTTTKGMQRTVSVSSTTLGALETGQEHTSNALGTATQKTGTALSKSYRAVKGWFKNKSEKQ